MELFDQIHPLDSDVYRNIVSLLEAVDLFDELTEGDPELSDIAIEAEAHVKAHLPTGLVERGFHYSTAIEYPFRADPFMRSRYGDGTYGLWYGSLEQETTIFETAFHALMGLLGDILDFSDVVQQERAVYLVHCKALLIDLRTKKSDYPDLVANDYSFCRQIGYRLHHEGHPGILAPSARYDGTNLVIFEPKVLSDPRVSYYLQYELIPTQRRCLVKRNGELLVDIRH